MREERGEAGVEPRVGIWNGKHKEKRGFTVQLKLSLIWPTHFLPGCRTRRHHWSPPREDQETDEEGEQNISFYHSVAKSGATPPLVLLTLSWRARQFYYVLYVEKHLRQCERYFFKTSFTGKLKWSKNDVSGLLFSHLECVYERRDLLEAHVEGGHEEVGAPGAVGHVASAHTIEETRKTNT